MSKKTTTIGVVGGGAFGTAISQHLSRIGHKVFLWVREPEVAAEINQFRENRAFLPGLSLSDRIQAEHDLGEVVRASEVVVFVVPSQYLRSVLQRSVSHLRRTSLLVSASKGIEVGSSKLLSEIYRETLPKAFWRRTAFISGPVFAKDLALGHPTAVALASRDKAVGTKIKGVFESEALSLEWTSDIQGVALGGAVKNVVAIGCGILEGLGLGDSPRAALLTWALREMIVLGKRLGARAETFYGLSGMGDLILTCTGGLSRNKKVGFEIGQGKSLQDILNGKLSVAEGVETSKALHSMARRLKVKMPICEKVYRILHEGAPAKTILN